MTDQLLSIILADTYTLKSTRQRFNLLKAMLLSRLFGGKEFDPSLYDRNDLAWLNSLGEPFYQNFTKENIYQLFAELENKVKSLPQLVIYTAFDPGEEEIRQIGSWIRTNLTAIKLFDLKLDPNLIAGAALTYQGVYKDLSLRSRIEEKKQEILADFSNYLR